MPVDLYDASVPVFLRYLDRLRGLVDVADRHARSAGIDPSELLDARLAPDMLPFATQVEIAANFSLRACCPLAGEGVPAYGEFPASLDGLRERIGHVSALLHALPRDRFEAASARELHSRAGEALVSLPAGRFLLEYALPNFFFHLSVAYAILRQRGVAIGKAQFDGWHAYPAPAARGA